MSLKHHKKKIFSEPELHISIISFIVTNRNKNNYTNKF